MKVRKFEFTISTNRVGSGVSEIVEFEFEDDATESEMEDEVCDSYSQWVADKNYGGYTEVKS